MQRVRGLIAAILVGVPLGLFLLITLHATREVSVLIGSCVGVAVFAVVATGPDPRDEAADAAWQEAAHDLPPVSDRVILERVQATMPGPGRPRPPGAHPRAHGEGVRHRRAGNQGVEPK